MSELHIQTMRSNFYKKAVNMNLDAVAGAESGVEPYTPPDLQTSSLMTEVNSTKDAPNTFSDIMVNAVGQSWSRCDTSASHAHAIVLTLASTALILSNQIHYS